MSWSLARRSLGASLVVCAGLSAQILSDVGSDGVTRASTPTADAASPAQRAWQQFLAENGPRWSADWNIATDTPTQIWGEGLRLQAGALPTEEAARGAARALLQRYPDLFGIRNSELVESHYAKVGAVHMFGYRQAYRGFPVVGGVGSVLIHDNGVISLFGTRAFALAANFNTRPGISAERAFGAAHAHVGVEPQRGPLGLVAPTAKLVIFGDSDAKARQQPRLAWEVKIDRLDVEKVGRAYVDALNGRVLQYVDDIHRCGFDGCGLEGTVAASHAHGSDLPDVRVEYGEPTPFVNVTGTVRAWVNRSNSPNAGLTNTPMRNMRVEIVGGGSAFTDANGRFNIPHGGTATVQVRVRFRGSRLTNMIAEQGTAMVRTVSVRPGTAANIQIYTSTAAQFDRSQSTAYWATNDVYEFIRARGLNNTRLNNMTVTVNKQQTCNAFYVNSTTNYFAAGGGCVNTAYRSVVYHEYGHFVDDVYGGVNRNDGLSEGTADILAIIIANDPIVGRDFRGAGRHIRDARNTLTYPAGGGVHQQGMTWMGWFWDVNVNLTAKVGAANALNLLRRYGIGIFPANLSSQAQGVRVVFTLDDNDGNLNNGTPNCRELGAACTKRRLPNPTTNCGGGGNTTPTYVRYGRGCPGSGTSTTSTICASANLGCSTPFTWGNSNFFALRNVAPSGGATVAGFGLRTAALSGTRTVRTFLHLADSSGRPLPGAIRAGTMTVRSTYGYYYSAFSSPVTIPAGRAYYIAFDNAGIRHPICRTGTRATHYWHPPGTTAWRGPFTSAAWSYYVVCRRTSAGRIPLLLNSGLPRIGRSFDIRLYYARANTTAWLYTGSSRTTWRGLRLPYTYPTTTCQILAGWDNPVSVRTSGSGFATRRITYPNNTALLGRRIYQQWRVYDVGANRYNLSVSNAGEGRIGN